MVVLSAGVQPENGLAKSAGFKAGDKGFYPCQRQTRDLVYIYAVGDAVEVLIPLPISLPMSPGWPRQ